MGYAAGVVFKTTENLAGVVNSRLRSELALKALIPAGLVNSRVGGVVTRAARYICLFSANWRRGFKNPVWPGVN